MMTPSASLLSATAAAAHVGVSIKALRIYEQRGLVIPNRTAAGYRAYTPEQLARAGEVAALRALALSLGQTARVLGACVTRGASGRLRARVTE